MLIGPDPEDAIVAAAFEAAARKYALDTADKRAFVLGNNPRQRNQNNLALLTGHADYDVIFLADELGEFGRYLPYSSYLPRPVIGSEGLSSAAWDWTWNGMALRN